MVLGFVRRAVGTWLTISLILMALSACASGPMTMSEMVCCAEHHDDCEMAGQGQSCCAPDLQSDMGVLVPERSDAAHVTDAPGHLVVLPQHHDLLTVLDVDRSVQRVFVPDIRSGPRLLSTVLLI